MTEPIDFTAYRELHIDTIGDIKPKWDTGPCSHSKHLVDQTLRRVTCKDCGEVLDPIEVIMEYIHFWRRNQSYLDLIAKERNAHREREAEKHLNKMARQVRNNGGTWACTIKSRSEYWEV